MKLNIYNFNLGLSKTLLIIIFLISTLAAHAQSSFSICKGEEVVWVSAKPETFEPVRGCFGVNLRKIEPSDGVISKNDNGFTVSPIFTTTYTVTNRLSFGADSGCYYNDFGTEEFTVYVQECETIECNVNDPFNELVWLNELINDQDENGLIYYDYIKLYKIEDENYVEVFPELNNEISQIFTCDGSFACERTDSLSCSQFNENTLHNILYNTYCTLNIEDAESGDNKVDLQGFSNITRPIKLDREKKSGFSFALKNNGPCYLYETDFVIEVNGEVYGTENWTGSESPDNRFTVNTELKYHFKPNTDYTVRIWPVNPNGNRDLILTNDTTTLIYASFESNYNFQIQQFIPLRPIANDMLRPVSLVLDNFSNAKPDRVYIYWSVNGEEQQPFITEDFAYNFDPATFWDKFAKDTIEIGQYFFETDKPYLIEASVELPPEIEDETQPEDKMSYFVPAISSNIDLAITGLDNPLHEKINRANAIHLNIVNRGNIKINEFTIKWFLNEVEQTPVEVTKPDWQTQTNHSTFDEKVSILIDTLNVVDSLDFKLRFILETPAAYPDNNLDNNTFTSSYKAEHKKYYETDLYIEVCKDDSLILSVDEYTTYSPPPCPGCAPGCGYCSVTFFNKKWLLDGELIDTTLSITVKPNTNALYVFSTKAYSECNNVCSGAYDKRDVTVGVVLIDCEKPASLIKNCTNHLGQVLYFWGQENSSSIKDLDSENNTTYLAYDTDGMLYNFTSAYVKFDYELLGPQKTIPSNFRDLASTQRIFQPITITCLEEIGLLKTTQSFRYEVCEGDQIEEIFEMPNGLSLDYKEVVCNNLRNTTIEDISVNSNISNDCNFIFDVKEEVPYSNRLLNYTSKLQTGDYSTPITLGWNFNFIYQRDCEPVVYPILETYPFLTTFIDSTDCAGKSVYVYDADDYEFIIVKTHLAEILLTEEGKIYCMIPTGGFSFIELYDESRIIEQWSCEEGIQGKFSVTKVEDQGIQIFPNPAKDKVFINLQQLTFEQPVISVYDVQGRQVKQLASAAAFAGIVQMNVGDLERGIYLVEVRTSKNILTQKLLIQ